MVIIDNELDLISPCPDAVQQYGSLQDIGVNGGLITDERWRGEA